MEAPGTGMNLEKLVKEQLSESIKNADVLSMLQRMVDAAPDNEETQHIRDKLQEILTHYNGLNEEEKKIFMIYIKNALSSKLAAKLEEMPMDLTELEEAISEAVWSQIYIAAGVGVVFLLLLGMFYVNGKCARHYSNSKDCNLKP